MKPPVEGRLRRFPEVPRVLGSARRVGATSRPAGLSRPCVPSRTCDSIRVPPRGPTSGLRRLPEWLGQPSPGRGNTRVWKGLLAEMGVVGAPGGAREGRQQWEEVDSGAPGRGGQGEGLERVSGPLSAAPGPQDGSLPSQDTSLCLPTSTLHPAPGLAGFSPLRCPHPTEVAHTLCPAPGVLSCRQGTRQLPGTACGPSQTLPRVPSSTGRVRAHSPGLIQTPLCPSVSQPPSRLPRQGLITQRTGRHPSTLPSLGIGRPS